MAEAAPGRFAFGIGTSSNVIVESLERHPLRGALPQDPGHGPLPQAGADRARRSTRTYDTFKVQGFRLGRPAGGGAADPDRRRCARACSTWPAARPTAPSSTGCRPTTWPRWCPRSGPARRSWPGSSSARPRTPTRCATPAASPSPPTSMCPSTPPSTSGWAGARSSSPCGTPGRRATGRRATAAIPDEVVDDLIVHGSPEECRAHIDRYIANGVTTTALAILPVGYRRPPGDARPRPDRLTPRRRP